MEIHPLILQFGGSLIAILALAYFARALKLGGKAGFADEAAVREIAAEAEDGFEAQRISIARGGHAALARDAEGRIMLLKLHGNRYAGRILTRAARVHEKVDALEIDCGETRYGKVTLALEDAGYWADAINRL